MATRFYLPSTGTPGISPAFDATAWPNTPNADRIDMVTTRISSAMTTKDGAGNAATTRQLLRQYISAALAAQTLTGTMKGQARYVGSAAGIGVPAIRVAKCNSDGSTVTEIFAAQFSTRGTAPPAMDTVLTNRKFEQGDADFVLDLASTGIDAGDRLIVEIGYTDTSTNTARFISVSFGDNSATDLAEDETTTTADNPWVEFSANISFQAGGGTTAKRSPFASPVFNSRVVR